MSSQLKSKINDLRRRLNGWEKRFYEKHNRKPEIKDIKQRDNIANHYKEYSDLKKQLRSEVGETPRSLSSGSRILFPETRNSQPAPCLERQYTEEEAFWLNVSPSDIVQSQNSDNPSPDPCSTIKKRKLVLAEANIEERKRKKLAGEPKKTKKKLSKDYMYYSLQFKSEEKNTKSKTQSQEVVNVTDEDKEDDKTPYEIVSYEELQHVRHTKYKFEWQDDSFCTVSEEYSPDEIFLSQREIIKTRLMNKTLGMVTEENEELEKNALEKLFQIAKNNKIIIPEQLTTESPTEPEVVYKKKPIQKRRSRSHKLKFVG